MNVIAALKLRMRPPTAFLLASVLAAAFVPLVFPESRAQVPAELVHDLRGNPPQGYDPAHPKFSDPQLCLDLGGEIHPTASGEQVCTDVDVHDTFCIVGSRDAFPCRGLFKHVIACNGVYNRPALSPFLCARQCIPGVEKARGLRCELAVIPNDALPAFQKTISYDSPPQFTGAIHTIAVSQRRRLYTLYFQDGTEYGNFYVNQAGIDWEVGIRDKLSVSRPTVIVTIGAKIQCPGCYPEPVDIVVSAQLGKCSDEPILATETRGVLNARLWTAVTANRWDDACLLIREGAGVNSSRNNESLLHSAARLTDGHMMKLLLDKGANLNVEDDNGDTPLHDAINLGDDNLEVARLLLNSGAKINAKNNNDITPIGGLFPRALYGHSIWHERMIILAIENGANVTDEFIGDSLLWRALGSDVEYCYLRAPDKVIEALIKSGANVTVKSNIERHCGADDYVYGYDATLLHRMAQVIEDKGLISLAIAYGADINAKARDSDDTPLHRTPLHYAARTPEQGTLAIKALLENGADVDGLVTLGVTPMMLAIMQVVGYGSYDREVYGKNQLEKAKLLAESGANINIIGAHRRYNLTPLHLLARINSLEALELTRLFIERGADINAETTPCQMTPARMAHLASNFIVRDYLLQNGGENSGDDSRSCRI